MDRLYTLMEESVVVSGLLALMIVGAVVYLAVIGMPIPDLLGTLGMMVVAFFFESRNAGEANRTVRSVVAATRAPEVTGNVPTDF